MTTLPHSLTKHIFTFILQPYEINLLNNTNLEIEDVKILEDKQRRAKKLQNINQTHQRHTHTC